MKNRHLGVLIGGGILALGLALQLSLGPIDWAWFAAPVNGIMLVLLLGFLVLMYLLRKKVFVFEWLMQGQAALASLAWALGITMVTGFLPQAREGSWPFVLLWTWAMVVSGLASTHHLLHFKRKDIPFLLNHLGVFVAVVSAALGSADVQQQQVTVYQDCPEWLARPGFTIQLHSFSADTYENGAPRRYASDISACTEDGKSIRGVVEVNKPLKLNGWKIYQYGYDNPLGSKSPCSVFLLVKDPWLPAVYFGIFLMLAGALSLIVLRPASQRRGALLGTILLTVVFTILTVLRLGPSVQSLPPALQSPWFIPHVLVYMISYALLGVATLRAVYMLFSKRWPTGPDITDRLVQLGLAFFTLGMLMGALWAKEAWGHYWTWDPKETWAAITWLCCLLYLHFRAIRPQEWKTACWILLLSFACLQLCWWGINYLPSAQGLSLHVY